MSSARLGPPDILRRLHLKFSANLDSALTIENSNLAVIEIKAQALGQCGPIMAQLEPITAATPYLAKVAEEVFADVVSSVYVASIGLVRPAHMILLRALELGVAVIYLWDLPHLFWGWKDCDQDLVFSEMIDHLEGKNYRAFLTRAISLPNDRPILDGKSFRRIYRIASNTTHGKLATHKVVSGDGFDHDETEWTGHMALVDEAITQILSLWFIRFPKLSADISLAVPAYSRVCSEV